MTKYYRGVDDKGVTYSGVWDFDQRQMDKGHTRLVDEHEGHFVYWDVLTKTIEEIDRSDGIDVSEALSRLATCAEPGVNVEAS